MSRQDLFERILASLSAAALDDTLWPRTSGLIDEFCESKGNMLVTGDGTAHEGTDIFFAQFCYRGERHSALEQEYFTTWHALDERLPRIRVLPDGQLASASSLFSGDEMKVSALYNKLMLRTDTRDSLCVRLDGPDNSRIVWTVADSVDGEGWMSDRLKAVRRLLPFLRQFILVRHTLVRAGGLGMAAAELFNTIQVGVVQLNRRGEFREANSRAHALLSKGDGLELRERRLRASLFDEDARLQKLLAQAWPFPSGSMCGGSMRISRSHSVSQLVLHVHPMFDMGMPVQGSAGVLVLVIDPTDRMDIDPERAGKMFGLTPAESQIAVLLAQGKSVDEVARETGRRPNTVKWHLRHIYDKCGLSNRIELAELMRSMNYAAGG